MSRTQREGRHPLAVPTMAVAGELDLAALRAAGWALRGTVSPLPYADRLGAATYVEPREAVEDAALDAVAVDGSDPDLAGWLPGLRGEGLLLLLAGPAPLDVELLQRVVAQPEDAPVVVGLTTRLSAWARTAARAAPLAGGPCLQLTVRGWPAGPAAAAELVDLVTLLCGETVAATAAPAPLPAHTLPGDLPVAWSLLTATGTTVLVSHAGDGPLLRLSYASARLEVDPAGCRWEGGERFATLADPDWLSGLPRAAVAEPHRHPAGLAAPAAALAHATRGQDLLLDPGPAGLGDLLAVARVLEALRASARAERTVPVA